MNNIKNKLLNIFYFYYLRFFRKYVRLSSRPFVSGDTFRNISDHRLDEISNIDPRKVSNNALIFIKTDYLDIFFDDILPQIESNINLITHNSDYPIGLEHEAKVNEKINSWFAQNLNFVPESHSIFHALPIGLENRSYFKNGKITHFKSQNTSGGIKLDRIYCSFNTTTNKERIAVLNYAKNNNLVDFKGFSNHKNFVRNLSSYKFAICPEGNGLDTHRFWESLITKTLPIVKKSDFITNFYNIGIPMIVLDDWKELITLDEDTLKKLYNSNYEKLHSQDYITLDFWLERIVKQYLD